MPRHPDKTPGTGAAPSPSPSGTVVVPEVGSELRSARAPGHMYSSDMATRGRSASFSRSGCVTAS